MNNPQAKPIAFGALLILEMNLNVKPRLSRIYPAISAMPLWCGQNARTGQLLLRILKLNQFGFARPNQFGFARPTNPIDSHRNLQKS
jgi:hypothetical protein